MKTQHFGEAAAGFIRLLSIAKDIENEMGGVKDSFEQ